MAQLKRRNGGDNAGTLYWEEEKLTDQQIKHKLEKLFQSNEIPHIDNFVAFYKSLYYHSDDIPRVPLTREETETRIYLEEHLDMVRKICNMRMEEHYGVKKAEDMLAIPQGYRISDMPKGYPQANRNIADAFAISNEEIKARTQDTPLVPIYKDGENVIRLLGLDKETDRPVLFSMIIDSRNKNLVATHTKLVVYMGGVEQGLLNIERPTYKPNTIHADIKRDEKGRIVTNKKGVAEQVYIDPIVEETHTYNELDRLLDPHGYTAAITSQDPGYVLISQGGEKMAIVREELMSGEMRSRKVSFIDSFSNYCSANNILCNELPTYLKNDQYGLQLDTLFPDDAMLISSPESFEKFANQPLDRAIYEEALITYQTYLELTAEELAQDDSREDLSNPMLEVDEKGAIPLPEGVQQKDTINKDGSITKYDYSKDAPAQ